MMSKPGKTLLFALVIAGVGGAFWLAVRNFPRPELQKAAEGNEEPGKVEPVAGPALAAKELRARLETLADLVARDERVEARDLAGEIAKSCQYEHLMPLFLPRGKGDEGKGQGLGIGSTPGAIRPDGIEQMLLRLEQEAPAVDLAALMPMTHQLVAIALVMDAIGPVPAWERTQRKHFADFQSAARRLASAVDQNDRVKVTAAAQRVNQACYSCHQANGGAPLLHSLEGKTTEGLVAIVTRGRGTGTIDERPDAIKVLGQRGPAAIPALIEVLKDPEEGVKKAAVATLKTLGQKDSTGRPALDACLKDDQPYLRFWFAHRIASAKSPAAMLMDALKDPDRDIRAKSAELLGHMPDDAAAVVAVLKATLENDKDEEVRWAATRSLGRFKTDDAVAPLLSALKDKDPIVRGRAALGLAKVGKGAVPGLRAVLKETDRDVTASALGALGRMGSDAKDAVPELLALLKVDDPLLQKLASDALRKIDPKAAEEAGLK